MACVRHKYTFCPFLLYIGLMQHHGSLILETVLSMPRGQGL